MAEQKKDQKGVQSEISNTDNQIMLISPPCGGTMRHAGMEGEGAGGVGGVL